MKKFVILFILAIQSSILANKSSSQDCNTGSREVHAHKKECSCQESKVIKYFHAVEKYLNDKKESIKNRSKKAAAQTIATTAEAASKTYILAIDLKEGISSGLNYVVEKVHNLIDWANENK